MFNGPEQVVVLDMGQRLDLDTILLEGPIVYPVLPTEPFLAPQADADRKAVFNLQDHFLLPEETFLEEVSFSPK